MESEKYKWFLCTSLLLKSIQWACIFQKEMLLFLLWVRKLFRCHFDWEKLTHFYFKKHKIWITHVRKYLKALIAKKIWLFVGEIPCQLLLLFYRNLNCHRFILFVLITGKLVPILEAEMIPGIISRCGKCLLLNSWRISQYYLLLLCSAIMSYIDFQFSKYYESTKYACL